jgi:acetyl-CoA carboxylase biotin carboxyl carrier protein
MQLTLEQIQALLKLVEASSYEEFRLETPDFKLVVRKAGAAGPAGSGPPGAGYPSAATTPAAARGDGGIDAAEGPLDVDARDRSAGAGGSTSSPAAPAGGRAEPVEIPAGHVAVRAPMVGTFYRAPAPGAQPFVEVGRRVAETDTVCILEVMKLMNSIPAGVAGVVAGICVENAALVEYGQPMVLIQPDPGP